jgi:hypothetical protein
VRLRVDRRRGVEGVAEAVSGGGRRHELGDPLGARGGDRERVEVRLGHELRRQQSHGDVPAGGGLLDRRPKLRRDEVGKPHRRQAFASGRGGRADGVPRPRTGRRAVRPTEMR